jgi:predicted nucleic acid-binding protein
MRFWDSSALVPLLVAEDSSDRLMDALREDPSIMVWWGSPVECASAVARREREELLGAAEAGAALERLDALQRAWHEIPPTEAVRMAARRMLRVHPLPGADALQLAAAVTAAEGAPHTLELVTLDERLRAAAAKEGFRLLV